MVIFILILIGVLTGLSTFISTLDIVKNKKLTCNGKWLISINVLVVCLLISQYFVNEREQTKKDIELKNQYDSTLRIVKANFDTSTIKIVETIIKGLDKQGFKIDSGNLRMAKIISDSAKVKINTIIEDVAPVFGFRLENAIIFRNINNDDYNLDVYIESRDASSTDFDCELLGVVEDSLGHFYCEKTPLKLLDNNYKLSRNTGLSMSVSCKLRLMKTAYLIIHGTYKNLNKTKTYEVNEIYYYDKMTNKSGKIMPAEQNRIFETLKRFNLI